MMKRKFNAMFTAVLVCLAVLCLPLAANASAKNKTRIHFICIEGNNDAILLESNGHFGMVDSGEDSDYPRGNNPKYPMRPGISTSGGHEQEVIKYLKKVGVKKLDFYIGTHAHSDHIGSGDEILKAFKTERLYLNKYSDNYISVKSNLWDNQYCYDTLISAAKKRGTKIIQNFSKTSNRKFTLGDMEIEIMNYKRATDAKGNIAKRPDDNYNSLGVKVTVNDLTAFLAGDISNLAPDYDESKLSKLLGPIDLLKLGHHGIGDANSPSYLRMISPDYAVATGLITNMSASVRNTLNTIECKLFTTNGQPKNTAIIADMTNGKTLNMISPGNLTLKKKSGGSQKQYAFYTSKNKKYARKNTWIYYNENYYYINSKGNVERNSWKKEGNYYYYLDNNGIMQMNAARVRGIPYSFDASGKLSEGGWTRGSSSWSYADNTGRAKTGWAKIEGKWYYFNRSGIMKTGWIKLKDKQYFLRSNGQMAANTWINYGGVKYYVGRDGMMLRNTKRKIKGKFYRFDDGGVCINY